jgi:RNA polymerase sigma factor (sigma-70 family)
MTSDGNQSIGSVTILLNQVKDDISSEAAQKLFERYIRQLEWVARGKMGGLKHTVSDEEDFAVTVLGQFFLGVRSGRFPKLNDRHDLWQILLLIMNPSHTDAFRRNQRKELGESAIVAATPDGSEVGGVGDLVATAVTPKDLAEWEDQIRHLLAQLPQEKWRQVALWKLEQRTNSEIARLLKCSVRQVERILEAIREQWQASALPD